MNLLLAEVERTAKLKIIMTVKTSINRLQLVLEVDLLYRCRGVGLCVLQTVVVLGRVETREDCAVGGLVARPADRAADPPSRRAARRCRHPRHRLWPTSDLQVPETR